MLLGPLAPEVREKAEHVESMASSTIMAPAQKPDSKEEVVIVDN